MADREGAGLLHLSKRTFQVLRPRRNGRADEQTEYCGERDCTSHDTPPATRMSPVSDDGGGRGINCFSETFHGCVDLRGVNDERRRNQDMVAARAIHRTAHRIDHQPPRHRFAFDAGVHLQFWVERFLGAAVKHQLDAVK